MKTLTEYINEELNDNGNYCIITEGDNIRVINLDTNTEIINESVINEGLLKWLKGKFKKWFHSFTTGNMSDDDLKKSYKKSFDNTSGKNDDDYGNFLNHIKCASDTYPALYRYSKLNGGLFKHYEYFYKNHSDLIKSRKLKCVIESYADLITIVMIVSEINDNKTSELDKKIHEGLGDKYKGHVWLWEPLNTLDKSDKRYKAIFGRNEGDDRTTLGLMFSPDRKLNEVTCFLNEKYNGNAMKEIWEAEEIDSKYNGDGAPLGVLGNW